MSDAAVINQLVPTQDECTMGTLAHVLQLVSGWIAPLVIFLVKRNSRFVSFHALQALLLQGLYFFFVMILMGAFFAVAFAGIAFHQPAAQPRLSSSGIHRLFPGYVAGNDGLVGVYAGGGHCVRNQSWTRRMG